MTKVLSIRSCPRGRGFLGNPTVENYLFYFLLWTIKKIIILKKNKTKCSTVSKWRSNDRFLFRIISILAKIWKSTFPKEFFNELLLIVGQRKNIYIAEIIFGHFFLFLGNFRGKTIFPQVQTANFMLITEKTTDPIFFLVKRNVSNC